MSAESIRSGMPGLTSIRSRGSGRCKKPRNRMSSLISLNGGMPNSSVDLFALAEMFVRDHLDGNQRFGITWTNVAIEKVVDPGTGLFQGAVRWRD